MEDVTQCININQCEIKDIQKMGHIFNSESKRALNTIFLHYNGHIPYADRVSLIVILYKVEILQAFLNVFNSTKILYLHRVWETNQVTRVEQRPIYEVQIFLIRNLHLRNEKIQKQELGILLNDNEGN